MKTRLPFVASICAVLALAALLGGCVGTPTQSSESGKPPAPLLIYGRTPPAILSAREMARIAREIPASRRAAVLRAEAFGRVIYTHDRLAKRAGTLVAPGGRSPFRYPPAGWLTERTHEGLRLSFIVKPRGSLGVAAEVASSKGTLQAQEISPPRALTPQEITLWKARQLAFTTRFKPCSKRYNPVVIPVRVAGVKSIYVFLLPASSNPQTVYLGGYHRIAIDPNGEVILEDHAFTRGCVTLQRNAKSMAVQVTELLSDAPTAPQVYASLVYGLPVNVSTINNGLTWQVENGRISLAKK